MQIQTSSRFRKEIKILKKRFRKIDEDLDDLFESLKSENIGDRIEGLKGLEIYKARVKNSSSKVGKSGGFRVIYYAMRKDEQIIALTIYSKSEKKNISREEILEIISSENF